MNTFENDSFAGLKLSAAHLKNLEHLGYHQMTPVQAQALPPVLARKDVIARAKTGSGKTVAFGLGVLNNLDPTVLKPQALVLCPTRELAEQVAGELRRLARAVGNVKLVVLCGGKPFGPQKGSLQHGAHIVVGTPGRVIDHLNKHTLSLAKLRTLVLDEADRMLDMGFTDAMHQIVELTPAKRQTLLFSATYPDTIKAISRRFQKKPVSVTVDTQHDNTVIEALFYEIGKHERNRTLRRLFEHYQPEAALVFCHTKMQCNEVADFLNQSAIEALPLHGDMEQRDRDKVLMQFANASCAVLVATDVAARGLDIKTLPLVINYELPRDPAVYVHRIGRTGRAGQSGMALSLVGPGEQVRVNAIEEQLQTPAICDVPASLDASSGYELTAPMTTLEINVGKKNKLRPGDLLGALTGDGQLPGTAIGKINITDMASFVAIENDYAHRALAFLDGGRVKGRAVRARFLA